MPWVPRACVRSLSFPPHTLAQAAEAAAAESRAGELERHASTARADRDQALGLVEGLERQARGAEGRARKADTSSTTPNAEPYAKRNTVKRTPNTTTNNTAKPTQSATLPATLHLTPSTTQTATPHS